MLKELRGLFSCSGNRKMSGAPGQELAAASSSAAGGNTSARRKAEDLETIKLKLVDQDFKIGKLRDPFAPRPSSSSKKFPSGVTAEDEQRWLTSIRVARERGEIV